MTATRPYRTRTTLAPIILLTALLLTALLLSAPGPAAPQGSAEIPLSVEVLDGRGEPLDELAPDRLRVTLDGAPLAVRSVARAAPGGVTLYFDLPLLSTGGLVEATGVLAARAPDLTALAPVEVVVAGEDGARTVLPATRDAETLAQALSGLGVRYGGGDALADLRQGLLDALDDAVGEGAPARPLPVALTERVEELTGGAMLAEAALLRSRREDLISWAAERADRSGAAARSSDGTGALFLVTAGNDDDLLGFYRGALEAYELGSVAERLERPVVLPSLAELGRVMAAYDQLVFPYLPAADGALDDAGQPIQPAPTARDVLPRAGADPATADDPQRPAMITPRLGRRDRSEGRETPAVRGGVTAPAALAAETGGEVVTDSLQLADLVGRLGRRFRVTVPVPAGELRRLEVDYEGRRVETVRAPAWAGTVLPGSVAAVRVRRLLDGDLSEEGRLALEAAFEPPAGGVGSGRLTFRLEGLDGAGADEPGVPIAAPPRGPLRATVGVARSGAEPLVFHREIALGEIGADGVYSLPVTLPQGTGSRVAVLLEELAPAPGGAGGGSGRWGAAFASYLEPEPSSAGVARADRDLLPASRPIRLLDPDQPFLVGRTMFEVAISDPAITRVEFLLDGKVEVARSQPPYRANLNLGDLPRPRRVEAVAYGDDGSVLGRDLLVLNEGSGSFRVRIVEPASGEPESTGTRDAPRTGPVDVTAEVTAPPDGRVDRVDFYWNSDLVASRFAPPFTQRVIVPDTAPQGFVRVVARLSDGATAEDVIFLNSPGTSERLDVNLVEMYVVVTDRDGRPVSGLDAADFRVFEEGEPREIASFADGQTLPLTVGLVIDSSASMFVKLPTVGAAASSFVSESLDAEDRAFVVGFGGDPELVQATTSNAPELMRSIDRLRADGQTAIWESVVYSLVQIQGTPGKKALVLYTDGADEDEDFPYEMALRFARRTGVPIYFILTNNEIVRTGGKGLGVRRFLGRVQRIAEAVGGRTYLVRQGEDLSAVYAEIGRELRSQYLVSYYAENPQAETFRRVRVETIDEDLDVRTIAGYMR
jgi:Ca-activated chloride channel homolog